MTGCSDTDVQVSSLYIVDAVSFITFSFILRRDLLEFEWTGSAGRFWVGCSTRIYVRKHRVMLTSLLLSSSATFHWC